MDVTINKRLKLGAIALVGALMALYEGLPRNLIEPNPTSIPVGSPASSISAPFKVLDRSMVELRHIMLVNSKNTMAMENRAPAEPAVLYYKIDLKDGRIESLDSLEQGVPSIQRCLPSSELEKVKDVLRASTICESPEVEMAAKNIPCHMSYELPYAILVFNDGVRYRLGEKNTKCDYPTGLCGNQNDVFIELVRELIVNTPNSACHQ